MANSLNDGLSKPDQLANDAVAGAEMAYGQFVTGSPSAFAGAIIQYGSNISTAGSILDVSFGTAFKSTPLLFVRQTDTATMPVVTAGSLATTGFSAITVAGSKTVQWMAIGSGTF